MSSSKPTSVFVDGLQVPPGYTEESVKSAQNYRPRDDDVFVVTYPKCGTTWTQVILALILAEGDPEEAQKVFENSTFLELKGAGKAETMPRPGVIKTHLPFGRAPWSNQVKYFFVSRNPKDCCVSYYYHYKGHDYAESFDEYFELFIDGNVNFGDYFDHLMGWYEHRSKPNILFITYEEMKHNTEAAILKMASFIDDEKFAEPLRANRAKLNNVLKYSSFDQMKEILKCNPGVRWKDRTERGHLNKEEPSPNRDALLCKKRIDSLLVRKGVTGDWRNHFSEDQNKRMSEKFLERTKKCDLGDVWKNYM